MIEIYKDVAGFESFFKISNIGNLYSKRTKRNLKKHIDNHGYESVSTKIGGRNGTNVCFKIHRLVANAFLQKPQQYIVDSINNTSYGTVPVNHKDGNKKNNSYENLEWCTYKENTNHAITTGLIKYPIPDHGTKARYKRGCRCSLCKSEYSTQRRMQYNRTGK